MIRVNDRYVGSGKCRLLLNSTCAMASVFYYITNGMLFALFAGIPFEFGDTPQLYKSGFMCLGYPSSCCERERERERSLHAKAMP